MIQSHIIIGSDDYYSSILTKKYEVKVTLVAINGITGFGHIETLNGKESEIQQYIAEISTFSHLILMEVTHRSPIRYWTKAQHQFSDTSIYDTILASGSITQLPIIIQNGLQSHIILSPDSVSFRELLRTLEDRFSYVELRSSTSFPNRDIISPNYDILTKKQLDLFLRAWELGYYDIPRKISLEEIGLEVGIKRVGTQERLRRAEKQIMKDYYDKLEFHS